MVKGPTAQARIDGLRAGRPSKEAGAIIHLPLFAAC